MRENRMHGLTRGRWKPLTAVVRGRRVRRSVRERLQVSTSALLYLFLLLFLFELEHYPEKAWLRLRSMSWWSLD